MSKAGEPIKQHTHRNINQGGPLDPDIFPGFQRPVLPMLKGECDGCPEYYCVADTEVDFTGDGGLAEMSSAYGNDLSAETVHMYGSATYRVDYTFTHVAGSNAIHAWMRPTTGSATSYANVSAGGQCADGATSGVYSNFESASMSPADDRDFQIDIQASFFSHCDSTGTTAEVHVFYVSGPDPRFTTPCPPPKLGQHVRQASFSGDGVTSAFATDWHYMPNSLSIFVNGLDWIAQVTELDPATGAFELAYAPSSGSTVTIRYRRAA